MLKATAAGVLASLALQFLGSQFAGYVFRCCADQPDAVPLWYVMVSSPFGALVGLMPGFIAGWLSPGRGILAGFLVGLLGNAIYTAVFLSDWRSVLEDGPLGLAEAVLRLIVLASSWALSSAAAGGTAQLVRLSRRRAEVT